MGRRQQLQDRLSVICPHVYFQPPSNVALQYPCIIYKRDALDSKFADNGSYHWTKRYQVTVIDKDPDSAIVDQIASLPMCVFAQNFVNDNLNHDVFSIYF